jgi:hypothetical protein
MTTAFSYADLQRHWRKSLRNGNWRKLNSRNRGLYMAAMWYARVKGEILSGRLVAMLGDIIEKLVETIKDRIFRRGLTKAADMERGYEKVFSWAPELREWLKDPDYIFWLGVINFRSTRVRKRT